MPPAIDTASERRNLRPVHIAVCRTVSPEWRHRQILILVAAVAFAAGFSVAIWGAALLP
jgi:hypothetical protein